MGRREIAHLQEKAVTFMAKWDEKLAGSGQHVHISLWDPEGRTESVYRRADTRCGAVQRRLSLVSGRPADVWPRTDSPVSPPMSPPYKRFQSGSFAPTGVAWSDDNRTAGFRVVGSGPSLRIECRIPGADANPYLVYAAVLAAGLEGIRTQIEPPPPFTGDIYQARELPPYPGQPARCDCRVRE